MDCFTYGKYYIKVEIYKTFKNKKGKIIKEQAIPYQIPIKPFDEINTDINEDEKFHINYQNNKYISSVIYIKKSKQENELNEMCRFKFEEPIKENYIEFHLEISIWRYSMNIYDQNELKKIELDNKGYENIYQRNYLIKSLRKDINQFFPVFFDPNRSFILYFSFHSFVTHFKFSKLILKDENIDFISFLKDITNNFEEKKVERFNYLFNNILLRNLKNIYSKINDLLDLYYNQREIKLMGLTNFREADKKNIKNRNFCFTNRDKLILNCIKSFEKNLSIQTFREMKKISENEKKERIEEFNILYKDYENYEFLDREQKEILTKSEMINLSKILREYLLKKNGKKNEIELFFFGVF